MGAAINRHDNRVIHYAVVASIVFHGLLLSLAPKQASKQSAALPGPIVARLVQPAAPPAAPPSAPQSEPPLPKVEAVKPEPVPLPPKPSPIAKPSPKAAPKAAPSAPAKPSAPAPSSEPAPSAPAAPPSPGPVAKADPQPAAPSTAPAPSVEDAGSLAQYRMQLIGIAKRYKRYPRVAMDNNWEGDVVVRMVIGANGMIASISVKTSSGHEILDKQAVEMFQKAKPLVPIPSALRGKEFAVEVRAIYNLKEPDSG
jgi:protein TonB